MADTAPPPALSPAPSPASARPPADPKLDELMLAMDVVDTLRHQDSLVARELDETRRASDLLERLRQIYRGQGIEVPDRVLQEGVEALRESRFVYTPPPPSLGRTLARAWVNRGQVGRALLGVLVALGLGAGGYYAGVVLPERQRVAEAQVQAERAEVALREQLPRALEQGHAEVLAEARVDAPRQRAARLLADGQAAVARRDAAGAEQAIADLESLRADLRREYTLRIVSRPGEPSGVFRIPARNQRARNYYLIVEAVTPEGRLLSFPITHEEDGRTETVSRWGVRVSEAVFDQIRRDKNDDGIVQRNRLAEKRRGYLEPTYNMPVAEGTITRW